MDGLIWIDPAGISFYRSESGGLEAEWRGRIGPVAVSRLFPVSEPGGMIRVSGMDGEEWGVVRRLSELSPESKRDLEKEIRQSPYLPIITSIVKLRKQNSHFDWETATDFGVVRFHTGPLYEAVADGPEGVRVVTDAEGQSYLLPADALLDKPSRKRLGRWL